MTTNQSNQENQNESAQNKGWLKWLIPGIAALALLMYFGMRSSDDANQLAQNDYSDSEAMKGSSEMATTSSFNATGGMFKESNSQASNTSSSATSGSKMNKAAHSSTTTSSPSSSYNSNSSTSTAAQTSSTTSSNTTSRANMPERSPSTTNVSYSVNQAGHLVDGAGKVVYKAGEFTVSEEGYYMDKKGNRIGMMLKKVGEAVGKAANATGKAVGTAAEKTGEFFNKTFTKMFKKEGGTTGTYTLSNIEFNPENHRITNFSKAEVEGLAAALKSNPNAKIQVQAHTNDGSSDKESKTLSATRAKVVHDMLVTLGVNKKQISSKGMGSKEASKASSDKVEIFVE